MRVMMFVTASMACREAERGLLKPEEKERNVEDLRLVVDEVGKGGRLGRWGDGRSRFRRKGWVRK